MADGQAAATVSGLLERNVAGGYGGGAAAFVQAVVNLSAGARLYENRAGGSGGCVYAGGGPSSVGEFSVRCGRTRLVGQHSYLRRRAT